MEALLSHAPGLVLLFVGLVFCVTVVADIHTKNQDAQRSTDEQRQSAIGLEDLQ